MPPSGFLEIFDSVDHNIEIKRGDCEVIGHPNVIESSRQVGADGQ